MSKRIDNGPYVAALVLAATLAGCAAVPGSHLSYDNRDVVADAPGQAAELPVVVRHITPGLIQSLAGRPAGSMVSEPQENEALNRDLANYVYRVGKGDVLTISVLDNPEFTEAGATPEAPPAGPGGLDAQGMVPLAEPQLPIAARGALFPVHRDGNIMLAYAGKVMVEGKTLPQIQDQVTRALTPYIRNPRVYVTVRTYQSQRVYLTGDIGKSGTLPITTEPLTLFDAVTRIGLAPTPDLEEVTLVRNRQSRKFSLERLFKLGDASQNVLLMHGDVLNFQRNNDRIVYVLGEVGSAMGAGGQAATGRVPIGASGITLGAALAQAGGINQLTARATGVFVMRGVSEPDGKRRIDIFQLDARNATAYVLADGFFLQPRDFVYVTAAPVVRFNRVMSQIVPFASSVFVFDAVR